MRFEEDEDRNLCLIAYPLKGDHGAVDIVDNSDCEPKSKLLRWTNKKHHVLETEKSPKEWVRQHRKEEKMKRWVKLRGCVLGPWLESGSMQLGTHSGPVYRKFTAGPTCLLSLIGSGLGHAILHK